MVNRIIIKSLIWGVSASAAMSIFYFAVMFFSMQSIIEVRDNFLIFWYLIIGIVLGFGVQVALWIYLKNYLRYSNKGILGISGTASGTSMIACCLHHIVDVLPIIGLSAASLILARYQRPLLIMSLLINLLGIAYMIRLLNKEKVYIKE